MSPIEWNRTRVSRVFPIPHVPTISQPFSSYHPLENDVFDFAGDRDIVASSPHPLRKLPLLPPHRIQIDRRRRKRRMAQPFGD